MRRLLNLPDWVAVFPGHFEGPCGAGMCGRPSTTIGFERRFNPLARLDGDSFVTHLRATVPPRPLNTSAIEATNRGLADMAWAMPTGAAAVPAVDAAAPDLPARLDGAFVLDVREPGEYAAGHLPGAVNVPQGDLASRLAELPRDRPILSVCQGGARSLRAAQFLLQVGFADVSNLTGGTSAWVAAGRSVARPGSAVG